MYSPSSTATAPPSQTANPYTNCAPAESQVSTPPSTPPQNQTRLSTITTPPTPRRVRGFGSARPGLACFMSPTATATVISDSTNDDDDSTNTDTDTNDNPTNDDSKIKNNDIDDNDNNNKSKGNLMHASPSPSRTQLALPFPPVPSVAAQGSNSFRAHKASTSTSTSNSQCTSSPSPASPPVDQPTTFDAHAGVDASLPTFSLATDRKSRRDRDRRERARERSMYASLHGQIDAEGEDLGSGSGSGSSSFSEEGEIGEDGDVSTRSRSLRPSTPIPDSNSDSTTTSDSESGGKINPDVDAEAEIATYTYKSAYASARGDEPVFARPVLVSSSSISFGPASSAPAPGLDVNSASDTDPSSEVTSGCSPPPGAGRQQPRVSLGRTSRVGSCGVGGENAAAERQSEGQRVGAMILPKVHPVAPRAEKEEEGENEKGQERRWPPASTSTSAPSAKSRRPRLTLPLRLPSTLSINTTATTSTRAPAMSCSRVFPTLSANLNAPVLGQVLNRGSSGGEQRMHVHSQHQEEDLDLEPRTPNVYINGLPPQYPESALYTLTCAFGEVRSVRTFTRHVCGRASGYGFVLFDTVEAAEKCIDALKHYRNLHPSFSKQMHKIPGASYAPPSSTGSTSPLDTRSAGSFGTGTEFETDSDGGGRRMVSGPREVAENTFRVRMEKLRDENSTNLYFEGLPLSIDEPTLAALVTPFTIKSSRFFQTKLSDPPRIIAFVRLETRAAAEEIIERLHGRMVRGWNEPGCRISVRFADSAEQREMRRSERAVQDREPSPNRLTIAQAALLNLRGQGLQQPQPLHHHHNHLPTSDSDDFKVIPHAVNRYYSSHPDAFSSNTATVHSPTYSHAQPHDLHTNFNPDMVNVLESMRAGQVLSDGYSGAHAHHARARAAALAAYHPQGPPHVPMPVPAPAQTQSRSGFTLAEERILQAHGSAQHPYQQQPRLTGDKSLHGRPFLSGPRGPSMVRQGPHVQSAFRPQNPPVFSPIAPTGTMSEDEFHHAAQGRLHPQRPHHYQIDMADGDRTEAQNNFSDFPYSRNHDHPQQLDVPISSNQNSKYQISPAHMRSTTLPSSHFNQQPYRQHHSSISFPPSNTNNLNRIRSNNYINTGNHNNMKNDHSNSTTNPNRHNDGHIINSNNYDSAHFHATLQTIHDDSETDGSPLVSPSLTYSSRTPSTLSPATPFFGSFAHAQENFKDHVQENFEGLGSGLQEAKQRVS